MASDYIVAVEGLANLRDLQNLDVKILTAARQAINRTAERTKTASAKEMRQQINFPARYLTGANGRLAVSRTATNRNLAAVISGRDRPTSLARFANDRSVQASRKRGGVDVTVSPGHTKFMQGAFLMQLKNGNIGLALRLKEGDNIRNKKKLVKVGRGLYLLYGPSVDQVFRSVSEEQVPKAATMLETEFLRLLEI